jgi:hypothetical protein
MAANVIRKKFRNSVLIILSLSIFLYLIYFTFLKSNGIKYYGSTINEAEFRPGTHTYKLRLKIKGNVKCPIKFQIFLEDQTFIEYQFHESIDTIIMEDWYQEKLSFHVTPDTCIDDSFITIVELYE